MKLIVAIFMLLSVAAPKQAAASWFESCQISGKVLHQSHESQLTWRRTYEIRLSVTSAAQTDDNLGRNSYTTCVEHIGTEQSFQIKVPRSTRISAGGNLTIVRTAADGFNTQTGEMSRTVKYWFNSYQPGGGER